MFESPRSRLLVLVVAVGVLGGLLVYGGTLDPDPAAGAYPRLEDYAANPDAYVGQKVIAPGIVGSEDPPTLNYETDAGESVTFVLDGVSHPVEEGEGIRVFGVLHEGRRITVVDSFSVQIRGLWYAYLISFVSGLWALSLLVRTWRFDPDAVGLTPRDEPVSIRSLVFDRGGESDDG